MDICRWVMLKTCNFWEKCGNLTTTSHPLKFSKLFERESSSGHGINYTLTIFKLEYAIYINRVTMTIASVR